MKKRWMTGIVASLVLIASFCGINTTAKATNYIEIPTEVLELEDNDNNPAKDWEIINGEPEQIVGSQDTIDSELGTEETKPEIKEVEPEQKEEEDDFTRDQKAWSKAKLNYTYLCKGKTAITQLSIKKVPIETTDYTILWKSSNKKVATVDKEGMVTAIKVGSAMITCTVKTQSGYEITYSCSIEVTNPKFMKSTYYVAKGQTIDLGIKGTETNQYSIEGSDSYLVTVYKKQPGTIRAKRAGEITITANIDGVIVQCTVIVTNPKIKQNLYVLTANQTAAIQVYNQHTNSKISYSSNATKIATVTSKGKITTNKIGVAVVTVTVDNKEFEVTVAVGKIQAVNAIKNAQNALGCTYSQALRMKKGYYDCSSLVWRCYVPTGITFGYSKYASNAPTAAGEAYYLVTNKKEVATTYVDESLLRPGDLIFMANGYNGRFRNISHVAIYIGNDTIIHATPRNTNDVQYGTYSYYKNMIVSIGRPV